MFLICHASFVTRDSVQVPDLKLLDSTDSLPAYEMYLRQKGIDSAHPSASVIPSLAQRLEIFVHNFFFQWPVFPSYATPHLPYISLDHSFELGSRASPPTISTVRTVRFVLSSYGGTNRMSA